MEQIKTYYTQDEMIAGLILKDKLALKSLHDQFQGCLYGIISAVFEDHEVRIAVFQKAILKIWVDADQFDPEKEKFFTWMLNIVRQSIKDEFNHSTHSSDLMYRDADLCRIIDHNDFPVFIRIFFFGSSIEEIGKECAMSPDDVRKSLFHGIESLKKHLAQSLVE
ncbi:MAG: sigma-70 family RNA polymerase sigma factor [Candidatus Pedobacter colombiensis]|uniref:Sigma-70 family RNA polymerase sigma factor n=1 Tax=Candidatus Pedobacter colombiensis TaxID=3121371 RepID=A0AAJ5W5Z2_9SPHI|nr:sigma-70 family RNA polymerase sigma factor [Pedobacter sp.]WEK17876.1 MAG: sigma-70 family RNA polymerase sigma factor [Pedobacter sp.]